jgi:ribosomal protein L13
MYATLIHTIEIFKDVIAGMLPWEQTTELAARLEV